MKVVDIADEIYRELGSPTDLSIPPIAFWVRANIGKLNTALNRDFYVDETTLEIFRPDDDHPGSLIEFGEDEKAILKMIYFLHFFDLEIRKQTLTFNTKRALQITTNGHSVRLVSPTEVGRHFSTMRRIYSDDLRTWITWYRSAKATPRQVTGDDAVEGPGEIGRPAYHRVFDV